jgi:hypothetical protein
MISNDIFYIVNTFLVICWYKLVNVLLGTGGNRAGTTPKTCHTLDINLTYCFQMPHKFIYRIWNGSYKYNDYYSSWLIHGLFMTTISLTWKCSHMKEGGMVYGDHTYSGLI